jgi:hypothetical protein
MNAQSSRSHAIFSLTLTQKKYTGSGVPNRSSSPLPPSTRSPSRLARPGSMFSGGTNQAASPTQGRPSTPAFSTAMGRGGLRPSSAMGMRGHEHKDSVDEETGEWVTVVSKFHFVDLAGSERVGCFTAIGHFSSWIDAHNDSSNAQLLLASASKRVSPSTAVSWRLGMSFLRSATPRAPSRIPTLTSHTGIQS